MIVRSLLFLALFLGAYIILVPNMERALMPKAAAFFDDAQDYVQGNNVRGQGLLYKDLTGYDVFLGSSLTHRVAAELITPPFTKKEFIGGSALTGLSILAASKSKPKRVFIESNFAIARSVDEKLVHSLLAPPMGPLRRDFAFLRPLNRPSNLLMLKLYAPARGEFQPSATTEATRLRRLAEPIEADDLTVDEQHVRNSINFLGTEFAGSLKGFPIWLEELTRLVHEFEARGVRCCFYRMPFHPEVEADAAYQKMNAMLAERFPRDKYFWVYPDPQYNYKTTDGFHLTWKSGVAYSRQLVDSIARLEQGR